MGVFTMTNGKYFSNKLNGDVWVRIEKYPYDYCACERCRKPLKTVICVTPEDGYEYTYGSECINELQLIKKER